MTLEEMRDVDVRTIQREELVDIRDVEIDPELPREERIRSFVRQIGNPYCFKVGNVVVKTSFEVMQGSDPCAQPRALHRAGGNPARKENNHLIR